LIILHRSQELGPMLKMPPASNRYRLTSHRLAHLLALCLLVSASLVCSLPTKYSSKPYSQLRVLARGRGKICDLSFRSAYTDSCRQNLKYIFKDVKGVRKFGTKPLSILEKGSTRVPEGTNCGECGWWSMSVRFFISSADGYPTTRQFDDICAKHRSVSAKIIETHLRVPV
jgi:hypothetical protein